MRILNLISYAKLNLYLKVLNKRSDSYHSIFTLFERVSLADRIRLQLLPKRKIRILSSESYLPLGRNNLVYQAASLLQRECSINKGVQINIIKHIPISAGLGGGSSNAAVVFSGLNQLWNLKLGVKQLVAFARQIGSDIPFFLYNCSFACGTSRGDEIKVLRLPGRLWHIIVVPRVEIRSFLIYKKWDEMSHSDRRSLTGLTNQQRVIRILKQALLTKDILLTKLLFNSLEKVSKAMFPVISKVESSLSDLGIEAISMSGSGPAVFGLVPSRKEAYAAARKLKRKLRNCDVFVAKTV